MLLAQLVIVITDFVAEGHLQKLFMGRPHFQEGGRGLK